MIFFFLQVRGPQRKLVIYTLNIGFENRWHNAQTALLADDCQFTLTRLFPMYTSRH